MMQAVKNRYTELYAVIFMSLAVLVFWGSTAEGQASLIDKWARKYVEEAALTLNSRSVISGFQLADMNSFIAGSGGDGASVAPTPSLAAMTVQESSLLALSAPDGDYLERLSAERSQVSEYTVQE
jgi:hypothetical protein